MPYWPLLNIHSRVPICGLVAGYNGEKTRSDHDRVPELAFSLITKRITMKGFMSGDHTDQLDAFMVDMNAWLAAGRITVREDVSEGLERAPSAFIGMLKVSNFGKTIVRLEIRECAIMSAATRVIAAGGLAEATATIVRQAGVFSRPALHLLRAKNS